MGIPISASPGVYLGIPSFWGKTKCAILSFLKDRVRAKLLRWKQLFLSPGGREIMLKAVATALPVYFMSLLKFPKKTTRELNSDVFNYWWGQVDNERRIHWKSREFLTQSKDDGGIGFKDLETLNLALLGKQAWRCLTQPNQLWVQLLKGLYYPHTSFTEARRGSRSSWLWSSILEGREVLPSNICWSIGDGRSVQIWQDQWVPDLPSMVLQPVTMMDSSYIPRQVSEWIDHTNGVLKSELIDGWISEEDKNRILSIPLSIGNIEDKLVWRHEKKGSYTVSSAYKCLYKEPCGRINGASTSRHLDKRIWGCIWKCKIPTKLQHFLWRICNNALATAENLFIKKSYGSPLCPICGLEVESVEHLLLVCEWTKVVWFGAGYGYKIDLCNLRTMDEWLLSLWSDKNLTEDLIVKFIYILWYLWKAMNEAVIGGKDLNPVAVIVRINCAYTEFKGINQIQDNATHDNSVIDTWSRPHVGFIKVNCDGAFQNTSKAAAIGCIMRNQAAMFLEGRRKMVHARDSFMTEALAIREGLKMAIENQSTNYIIETDSQECIQEINKDKARRKWYTSAIFTDIDNLRSLKNISFKFARRKCNKAAHWLARDALNGSYSIRQIYHPPLGLVGILCKDGLPCPP